MGLPGEISERSWEFANKLFLNQGVLQMRWIAAAMAAKGYLQELRQAGRWKANDVGRVEDAWNRGRRRPNPLRKKHPSLRRHGVRQEGLDPNSRCPNKEVWDASDAEMRKRQAKCTSDPCRTSSWGRLMFGPAQGTIGKMHARSASGF
ncbi:hypothetical protein ANO11243_002370 [Dothideomycetidae sp. 11243]|nr:hypothetical protein ANO11243_002370 [fungal sp. No.11243]